MIGKVQLVRSGLVTSRLAFGTSRLHYVDRECRQRLLASAGELGIVHFDTAPAYGDGLAEREIGRFLRGRRERFVIATKYGIPADPLIAALPALAGPLRGARALARRAGLYQTPRPAMTAKGLRASVDASLRRLQSEWIDVLFLHAPSAERLVEPDAMLKALEDLRRQGLIRHFGLAGPWADILGLGEAAAGFCGVVQTGEGEWQAAAPPDITYGALSQGQQTYFSAAVDGEAARLRLRAALERRAAGVVIVSTRKPENLRRLAVGAEGF